MTGIVINFGHLSINITLLSSLFKSIRNPLFLTSFENSVSNNKPPTQHKSSPILPKTTLKSKSKAHSILPSPIWQQNCTFKKIAAPARMQKKKKTRKIDAESGKNEPAGRSYRPLQAGFAVRAYDNARGVGARWCPAGRHHNGYCSVSRFNPETRADAAPSAKVLYARTARPGRSRRDARPRRWTFRRPSDARSVSPRHAAVSGSFAWRIALRLIFIIFHDRYTCFVVVVVCGRWLMKMLDRNCFLEMGMLNK